MNPTKIDGLFKENKNPMGILVTGGAGYVGSHVVWALHHAGHACVVVDTGQTGFRELLPENTPYIYGNCGDTATMVAIMEQYNVHTVMHLAASLLVEESVRKPLTYYQNNIATTQGVVAACIQSGVEQLIFSSTAAVYGETYLTPAAETSPCQPVSPYGRTKLACEWLLTDTSAVYPFRCVVFRYFNVAGAWLDKAKNTYLTGECHNNSTHLIKRLCQLAVADFPQPLSLYGTQYPTPDGTAIRDYIHPRDIASAHLNALDYLNNGGTGITLNLGYGSGVSVKEVIHTAEQLINQPVPTLIAPPRPGDLPMAVANPQRAMSILGWQPKHTHLKEILHSALVWEHHWQTIHES